MKLLNKRILLKAVNRGETAIITPDTIDHFEVYEVGDEVTKVKKGDTVLYEQGDKFTVQGENYILTNESNMILII